MPYVVFRREQDNIEEEDDSNVTLMSEELLKYLGSTLAIHPLSCDHKVKLYLASRG
jgi:hypothetical protein